MNQARSNTAWLAMIPVCIMELMTTQDFAIVNAALTAMAGQFGVHVGQLHWAISAQLLTIGGLLVVAGRAGDKFGKKPVFVVGLCISALGNLFVSMAPSFSWLICARVFTGIGMALMLPVALSLVADLFTEPSSRDRALSAISVSQLVGLPTGSLFGGIIMEHFGWQAGFLLNGGIAVLTIPLALGLLPRARRAPHASASLDVSGIVLVAATSALLVWTISSISERGFKNELTLGAAAADIALIVLLALVERKVRDPILPLSILRLPSFVRACSLIALVTCLNTSLIFVLSILLQHSGARPAAATWLLFVPMTVGSFVGSIIIPSFVRRYSRGLLMVLGLSIDVLLLVMLSFLASDSSRYIPLVMFVSSVCMLFIFVPAQTQAFGDLPESMRGVGSSLIKMAYNTPTGVGVAIVAGALASSGMRFALLCAALFGVAGLLVFAATRPKMKGFEIGDGR